MTGTEPVVGGSTARATVRALARRSTVIALVSSAVLWGAVMLVPRDRGEADRRAIAGLRAAGCAYDTRSDPGRRHVDDPAYTVEPPAGGTHLPQPAPPGAYAAAPPDGELVHALEHGLVVVWLGQAAAGIDSDEVRAFHAAFAHEVVVVRRSGLDRGVVATAWHRRLTCPGFDADALRDFVCAFRGRGPERLLPRQRGNC